jgi:hypothetical protein
MSSLSLGFGGLPGLRGQENDAGKAVKLNPIVTRCCSPSLRKPSLIALAIGLTEYRSLISWSENAKRKVPGIQYGACGVTERLTIPLRQQPQQAVDQYLDSGMDWGVAVDLQFDKIKTAVSPSLNEVNGAPLKSMPSRNSRDQRYLVRPIYPTSPE